VRLTATYAGDEDPFEGDRVLTLRAIPAGALVREARATITPVEGDEGAPFLERLDVSTTPQGPTWGATKAASNGAVKVDFHTRRTLSSVAGSGGSATLFVDLGGAIVPIGETGAIVPAPQAMAVTLADGGEDLPPVDAEGILLQGTEIGVDSVVVSSPPTNVSLRLGTLSPFWVVPGELTVPQTTLDFAPVLAELLRTATVENGASVVPFVVHSDRIARLRIELELDLLLRAGLTPDELPEISLSFDRGGASTGAAPGLEATLPQRARVVAQGSTARLDGAFEPSRVAYGPVGPVSAPATVPLDASRAQAQPFALDRDGTVTGIDLLLAAGEGGASLSATLLPDSDGKPFGDSVLPRPLQLELDRSQPLAWTNATAEPFELVGGRRYWLVLRALRGAATWGVDAAPAGSVGLQASVDGGLSWRKVSDPALPGPLAAFARLLETPARFRMPIELRAGERRLTLERFEPLGRVDFALPESELAALVNDALAEVAAAACPQVDHLANADFAAWYDVDETELPEEWELTAGTISRRHPSGAFLGPASAVSQVVPVRGGCRYTLSIRFVPLEDPGDAVAEVLWRGPDCGAVRVDRVPLESSAKERTVVRRALFEAPADADEAEVRLVSDLETVPVVEVFLGGTSGSIANPDFQEIVREDGDDALGTWTVEPPGGVVAGVRGLATLLRNPTSVPASVSQRVDVAGGSAFELVLRARLAEAQPGAEPRLELRWLRGEQASEEPDVSLPIARATFDRQLAAGEVPADGSGAELRLVLPAGAAILAESVSLRAETSVTTPIDVVAQSPGELRVRDAAVSYDLVEPPAPPVPERGLCGPTPPGKEPGAPPRHCEYCPCCGAEHPFEETAPALTRAGRPAVLGRCTSCGAEVPHLGGEVVHGAPAIGVAPARPARILVAPVTEAAGLPLTAVFGIGAERARVLIAGGIPTLARLAETAPAEVAEVLEGLPLAGAEQLVAEARRLLASAATRTPPEAEPKGPEPRLTPLASLTRVYGIGPARARRLLAAGIDSAERLAAEKPETIGRLVPGLTTSGVAAVIGDAARAAEDDRGRV
jgi:predicted flap endonuclease-1-like 5' DNA nuclease